jgi:diguanylate cyclase (GGDEF)-like protein
VSSAAPVAGGGALADEGVRKPARIWIVHGLFSLLLVGYLISLVVRSADAYSPAVDGWGVDGWELLLCAMAFYRAFTRPQGRALSLALGSSMLAWSLGDVTLTIESLGGASPPTPSVADVFYVAFYPLAYLALVLLLRRESSKLVPATWLDGAVAGLGAAALCAAFAFDRILHLSGGGGVAATATNLAYPVGDVLLLAMAVGGSAVLAGGGRSTWRLVAAGCAVVAIGDTSNLFQATSSTHLGAITDGVAWPTTILLLSAAAWFGRGRSDLLAHQPAPGFLLPGLGAAGGLGILLAGSVSHVNSVAVGLAAATLAVVGVRLALSVASLRKLTEERHRQAITDQLTGLGNRRRLASVLDGFFADHADPGTDARRLAFLFVDLDQFKEVNDSFGHPAGDQLLTQIGPRFQRCLGPGDLLVRIGGDELAVVLVDADDAHAAAVAIRLAHTLDEPFELDMVSVQIGASIGVAFAPDDATDPHELMRCADKAMYRCKQTGTAYEIYDTQIDAERDRLRLMDDLRTAIAENQFELHYQPEVNVRNGTISAVEALLRWPHPRLGYIPPLEFLPLAEEGGLMRPLTTLVLDQALTQCARWRVEGQNLAVAINVSATNILDADFIDIIRRQLHRHQLPPSALVVEITETTLISDFERCKRVTEELTELGCMVSIDDFGAGFTSLAYLSRLAVGELKLDRTFLSGLTGEDGMRDLDLVRATIQLAHALGLVVVAEGVEEGSTLDLLEAMGCDLAQGYHIGRPAPASAFSFRTDLAA